MLWPHPLSGNTPSLAILAFASLPQPPLIAHSNLSSHPMLAFLTLDPRSSHLSPFSVPGNHTHAHRDADDSQTCTPEPRGSQLAATWPSKGPRAPSRDICVRHTKEGCYCHLVGSSQGCCYTPHNAQGAQTRRMIQLQMPTARLRTPFQYSLL